MRIPWKIVGLAGIAGVAATTGVVVARKRRAHTEYDPDELRDRLHSRVADAADQDTETAVQARVDEPAPWQAPAQADTAVHTPPHGDKVAEAAPGAEAPAQADTAVHTPPHGDEAAEAAEGAEAPAQADTAVHTPPHRDEAAEGAEAPAQTDTAVRTPPHGDERAERPSDEATD